MKKIIQIPITEDQEKRIKNYQELISGSHEMLRWMEKNMPKSQDESINRWHDDIRKNLLGLKRLSESNLGELLVSLQMSVGKIL